MRIAKILFVVLLLIAVSKLSTLGGDFCSPESGLLKGRSCIELNVGLWIGATVSNAVTAGGVQAEVKTGAFVGSIQFTHWMQEYLAVTLSGGLLEGNVSSTANALGASQHVSSVSPVLLGVRYYPFESAAGGNVRPYISAAAGPYIGSQVSSTVFTQGNRTETAFGGRLGAGLDFIIGDHFKLGANAGYNLMADYKVPVGGRNNYNGGDIVLAAGYIF